ncbi:MAG TPA: cysteine desulfurase family protein [Azospirillaceae bacterium]|nr:cysteine desulfurase family protein [Azospirillaceae bacterium]
MNTAVYLDYNATAPLLPAVRAALAAGLDLVGNPSSVHRFGREAKRAVEAARAKVGALVGVPPSRIVFTSGATEANNLALAVPGRRLVVSAVEHEAVRVAAPDAAVIPVDHRGIVDPGALDALLAADPRPALVAVMAVNNETGVIQPLAEVGAVAKRHGALVLADAVQAAGKIPLAGLGDFVSLSAHKIGGPAGVGALVVPDGVPLAPLLRGGGQEQRRRAGTENLLGIIGFGAAAEAIQAGLPDPTPLRDDLEERIRSLAPDAVVFGAESPRVGNTSCIGMPGVPGETQVMALDLAGVAVSAGSACSSGKVTPSRVLAAMGVAEDLARCAVRVSLGWASTPQDVDVFVAAWSDLYRRSRGRTRAA